MGLRDYLKKHEVKDEEEKRFGPDGEEEEGTTIDVGKAFGALKNLRKRKS